MNTVIIQSDTLNLPEPFSRKLRGKKVQLTESNNVITIAPVKSAIDAACGMFTGDGSVTTRFIAQKKQEKDLENG
ncbi:MAG: hypothetical protein FWC13_12440 [Oscillospiraceae bacterium]|nr:hypothetical protein [Oscillospiraceae bacterium]